MPRIELHDSRTGTTAWITPDIGFNCFRFSVRLADQTVEVIDAMPGFEEGQDRPTRSGIPLLFPFPNRIAGGQFSWDGRDYQLPVNPQGHAIHGFVFDRPWRVTHVDAISAEAEFQLSREAPDRRDLWPADFLLTVRYAIRGTTLFSEITVRNPDRVPLPWGFGTHSYFKVPLTSQSSAAQCLLQVPASREWVLAENIPTGEQRPVSPDADCREGKVLGGAKLDHLLTDVTVENGTVQTVMMDPQSGLRVAQTCDQAFREMVVFTPPHGRSVCMEPYTCASDAVHLQARGIDAGWRVLAPEGESRHWISIAATPIYV